MIITFLASLIWFVGIYNLNMCLLHASWNLSDLKARDINYNLVNALDIEAIREHVKFFASLGTRATGYPGNYLAAQYIHDKFVEYGLENITYQNFTVVDCVNHGANITILSSDNLQPITIHPILPNLVSPSTTPPEGISGRLIYARSGSLEDFSEGAKEANADVNGSIIILDWLSRGNWINAVKLGAKAVIFTLPRNVPARYLLWGDDKYLADMPLNFPRFYVEEAEVLLDHVGEEARIVSTQRWEALTGKNVIGFIKGKGYEGSIIDERTGKPLDRAFVVLSAYYDSYSTAPSMAPGAQEACGIAVLLELAKYFAEPENQPQNSIIFVAFGGHGQSLAGSRSFWTEYARVAVKDPAAEPKKKEIGDDIWYQINLDFSTGSDALVMMTWEGMLFGGSATLDYKNVWVEAYKHFSSVVDKLNSEDPYRRNYELYFSSLVRADGYTGWGSYTPVNMETQENWDAEHPAWVAFPADHGFALRVGKRATTFMTAFDPRPYYWTPFDTFEKVDFNNLKKQVELVTVLIVDFVNQKDIPDLLVYNPFSTYKPPTLEERQKPIEYGMGGLCRWRGQVVYWSEETGFYEPVPNAIVIRLEYAIGTPSYPRYKEVYITGEDGVFEVFSTETAYPGAWISAWIINETTGDVIMAPDQGSNAYWDGHIFIGHVPKTPVYDIGFLVLFNCSSMVLFDVNKPGIINPMKAELGLSFRAALSRTFWISPYTFPDYIAPMSRAIWIGPDLSIVAFPPNAPIVVMWGQRNVRSPIGVLMNFSGESSSRRGFTFQLGKQYVATLTTLRYAELFHSLSEEKVKLLIGVKQGISESKTYLRYMEAGRLIDEAKEALRNRDYALAADLSYRAWNLAVWAYNALIRDITDSVLAVPYLSFLLVPFVYLAEKLIFNQKGIKRVISFLSLFAALIGFFMLMHVGFRTAPSPIMTVIGFSVLILCIPLFIIMIRYVTGFLRELRRERLGVHEISVKRLSNITQSFTMGVEYMRRFKFRTVLVLISFILMTVSFVSFTSISTIETFTEAPVSGGNPSYTGLYLRLELWGGGDYVLPDYVYRTIRMKLENQATMVPRAWRYMRWQPAPRFEGGFEFETGYRTTYNGKVIRTLVLWGLSPEEGNFELGAFLKYGRWFLPGEKGVVILSEHQAERLGINVTEVGLGCAPTVYFETMPHKVIGIIGSEPPLERYITLDGEPVTPIRFNVEVSPNPWVIHVTMDEGLILPIEEVLDLGGGVASISIKLDDPSLVMKYAQEIRDYFPWLNVYVCTGEKTSLLSGFLTYKVWGLENQIVPIAIVILVFFNLFLSSVYERKKYINIYNLVGLSPLHISITFLAEAIVYALIGGLVGYVISMAFCNLAEIMIPGIALNYSSSWVFSSLGLAMLSAILASLYPAFLSSRIVTPSMERVWKIPTKPSGDVWEIPMPFHVETDLEAKAMLIFLKEFMSAHASRDAADFYITSLSLGSGELNGKPCFSMKADTRLFPYDLGVKQEVSLYFIQVEPNRWISQIVLERTGGSRENWVSLNSKYIDIVRKQILLWNSLTSKEKEKYVKRTREGMY